MRHQRWIWKFVFSGRQATGLLALALVFTLAIAATQAAPAQTFQVIHNFINGQDGSEPVAGLAMGPDGSLYGTACSGGIGGSGTVYKLTHKGPSWFFSPLYSFTNGSDGACPSANVVFGPNGTLYGTTQESGRGLYGTVFNLSPPPTACKAVRCPWSETTLYSFTGGKDGGEVYSPVTFDQAGNIYGTTRAGGNGNAGVVYTLVPSGGTWTESVIHFFGGSGDGANPYTGVVFDGSGNLYGTALDDVYELTLQSGVWMETILHTFQGGNDGEFPYGGLVFDAKGNLYGTTAAAGSGYGGTAFEFTPLGGGWSYQVIYGFPGTYGTVYGPRAALIADSAGNLYGTTAGNVGITNGPYGTVFKLTPSGGGWTEDVLYPFSGGSDGASPLGNLVLDANGNLYGTTYLGGTGGCGFGCGVVFETTP